MFVADNLAPLVDTAFGPSAAPSGLDVLIATVAFAFQIYGDFAGYSNMARGLSKLMGIELNVNFLFPYFVTSPQAFWRNWHISLSTWLRDYLYIPLGGNRGSSAETNRNLIVTMVLGGLWHGAAWTFVLWGLYQGVVLVFARALTRAGRRAAETRSPPRVTLARVGLGVLMFLVTCYGWLIFRAASVDQVVHFTRLLFTDLVPSASTVSSLLVPMLWVVIPLLTVHVYQAVKGSESAPMQLRPVFRYALYGAIVYIVLLFGDFGGSQFIYFQF